MALRNATQIQRRRSCSKCDHLIKVQMHKVFLNNLWIWLYLGIIKAKLAAEGQSRSQGRGFSAHPGTVAQPRRAAEPSTAEPGRAGPGQVRSQHASWNEFFQTDVKVSRLKLVSGQHGGVCWGWGCLGLVPRLQSQGGTGEQKPCLNLHECKSEKNAHNL